MNQPTFVLIISKVSPSCNKILPLITEIVQNQFPLQILDIDNPSTRQFILSTKQVTSVPTLALKNGDSLQWFEREKVLEILNFMKTKIEEKKQKEKVTVLDDLPPLDSDLLTPTTDQDIPTIDLQKIKQIQTKKTNKKAHEMLRGRTEVTNPDGEEFNPF